MSDEPSQKSGQPKANADNFYDQAFKEAFQGVVASMIATIRSTPPEDSGMKPKEWQKGFDDMIRKKASLEAAGVKAYLDTHMTPDELKGLKELLDDPATLKALEALEGKKPKDPLQQQLEDAVANQARAMGLAPQPGPLTIDGITFTRLNDNAIKMEKPSKEKSTDPETGIETEVTKRSTYHLGASKESADNIWRELEQLRTVIKSLESEKIAPNPEAVRRELDRILPQDASTDKLIYPDDALPREMRGQIQPLPFGTIPFPLPADPERWKLPDGGGTKGLWRFEGPGADSPPPGPGLVTPPDFKVPGARPEIPNDKELQEMLEGLLKELDKLERSERRARHWKQDQVQHTTHDHALLAMQKDGGKMAHDADKEMPDQFRPGQGKGAKPSADVEIS